MHATVNKEMNQPNNSPSVRTRSYHADSDILSTWLTRYRFVKLFRSSFPLNFDRRIQLTVRQGTVRQ